MVMDISSIKAYCAAKKGVTAEFPFDFETLVYKVLGKMFVLMPDKLREGSTLHISLKCDPTWAEVLRQTYPDSVKPGYHLHKRHWNTIAIDGRIPDDEILDMIDHSYEQVIKGLPKKQRDSLQSP